MSAADITALTTGIAGIVTAITALVVAISHVLHHDAPAGDGQPSGADSQAPHARS